MCASTGGGPYCAFGDGCTVDAQCGPGNCCLGGGRCGACPSTPPPPPPSSPPPPVPPPPPPITPPPPPPPVGALMFGVQDGSDCTQTYGYLCNQNNTSQFVQVYVFMDGVAIGQTTANTLQNPGGSTLFCAGPSHGFNFNAYPPSFRDGSSHGISVSAFPGGSPQILYSPKTVGSCAVAPPPPPPPPCGSHICGRVNKAENPIDPLRDIVVELRTAGGEILRTTETDDDGTYRFSSPPAGTYHVAVVNGRNQVSIPNQTLVTVGQQANFLMRGVPAQLMIAGRPGTFALVTPTAYTPPNPPTINQTTGQVPHVYSATTGLNGSAKVDVVRGAYFLSCWELAECHGERRYIKTYPQLVNSGSILEPQTEASTSCPTATCQ